tara:strand:+ start:491 stop:1579 length:1089 start_codon:yes stop_codon:yes gene_type:complete
MASLKANTVSGIGTGGPTFDGGLKFRSLNYLTIPKGTTVERTTLGTATDAAAHSATRAIFAGSYSYGNSGARPTSNVIDYVEVATTGDATDFGDLTESKGTSDGLASVTRGIWCGGNLTGSPYRSHAIDYVEIQSKGDAKDFGDASDNFIGHGTFHVSDNTRGVIGGGNHYAPLNYNNNIEYMTIATTGGTTDFGDLTKKMYGMSAAGSPTRGVVSSGDVPSPGDNFYQYIHIQSGGNAIRFGDAGAQNSGGASVSNSTRGVFTLTTGNSALIEFVTIATTAAGTTFGSLDSGNYRRFQSGACSLTRGLFAGGYLNSDPNYAGINRIDYITIATTGNSTEFGDLSTARGQAGGCSNGHGGLG